MICSFQSQDGGKKGMAKNREENQMIYLTVVLKEKKHLSICVNFFFIDQQYLQNYIFVEKLIQNLFLVTKNKTAETKKKINSTKKNKTVKQNVIYRSDSHMEFINQFGST
jgi:hypothetical protein